jgi:uncharacterized protein
MSDFVDREIELAELRALAERRAPGLALVYGRRRVGKTYLLEHAFSGRRVYYLASDSTPDLNRRELLRELSGQLGRELNPEGYPTWGTVFRLFAALSSEAPMIVVARRVPVPARGGRRRRLPARGGMG